VIRLGDIQFSSRVDTDHTQLVWNMMSLCPGAAWAMYGTQEVFNMEDLLIEAVGVQRTRIENHNGVAYKASSTTSFRIRSDIYDSAVSNIVTAAVQNRARESNIFVRHDAEGFERPIQQSKAIQWMVKAALLQVRDGMQPGPYRDMVAAIRMADTLEALVAVASNPQWLVSPAYQPGWEMLGQRMERWSPTLAKAVQRQAYTMLHCESILCETLTGAFVLGACPDAGWRRQIL
jgi:hypothetical protein